MAEYLLWTEFIFAEQPSTLCMVVTAWPKAVEEFSTAVGNLLFLVSFDAFSVVLTVVFLYVSSGISLYQVLLTSCTALEPDIWCRCTST